MKAHARHAHRSAASASLTHLESLWTLGSEAALASARLSQELDSRRSSREGDAKQRSVIFHASQLFTGIAHLRQAAAGSFDESSWRADAPLVVDKGWKVA